MFEKNYRFIYERAFWARYDSSRLPLVNYSTLPASRNRGPGLESETCGSLVWKVRPHRRTHRPVTRTLMTLRDRVLADICARWALHSRVYNEVRSVSLSLFLANFHLSLFLGGEPATWPGHGINRLCSTNWFRAKSKHSRSPAKKGVSETRPRSDAQAASLKSSSTL